MHTKLPLISYYTPLFVARVDVGAVVEQQSGNGLIAAGGGEHQRRQFAVAGGRTFHVDVDRLLREEEMDDVVVADVGGVHESRPSAFIARVQIVGRREGRGGRERGRGRGKSGG